MKMDSDQDVGLQSLQKLKSLCQMLRKDADSILAGKMGITITSRTLHDLNEAVDNLHDGLSPSALALDVQDSRPLARQALQLEDWNFHLQLVLDIVAKTPVLVLYKESQKKAAPTTAGVKRESSNPVSHPIRLGYFTCLNHLEICHLSVHSIQDLLKMRERLETLVVINSHSSFHIQDLLEMCDAVPVPMHWANLTCLCLRCNHLTELDGSLRLCPRLEMLDLSRNRLISTDAYLGYLMELRCVDLSYNNLTILPQFAATAKKKLRILRLAGNRIIDLTGVEEMTSLEELDVSENLVSCHHYLHPIRGLHRLDKFNMKGCPAAMRKQHIQLALQYISTVSLSRQFYLDGHPVTLKEIQESYGMFQNSRALMHHAEDSCCGHSSVHRRSRPFGSGVDQPDSGATAARNHGDSSQGLAVDSVPVRKKKGRKKPKTRTMEIPDMDTSTGGDLSSKDVTPATTPKSQSRLEALAQLRRIEVREKRAEMEHLRLFYGNTWLQAVEDQAVLPRPASTGTVTTVTADVCAAPSSGCFSDGFLSENPTSEISAASALGAMGAMAAVASGLVVESKSGESGVSEYRNGPQNNLAATGGLSSHRDPAQSDIAAESKVEQQVTSGDSGTEVDSEEGVQQGRQGSGWKVFDRDTMFVSSGSGAEDGGAYDLPTRVKDSKSPQSLRDIGDVCNGDESRQTEVTLLSNDSPLVFRREASANETVNSEHRMDLSESGAAEEPEDQSEPFIVHLPGQPDDPLLLTVSPRYLVEKDFTGTLQDTLDLQCLEAVRVEVEAREGEKDEDRGMDDLCDIDLKEVKVTLDFAYVRKDRRCRVYVMEDTIMAENFRELVQPFIDVKVEAAMKKLQVKYQCLKCSRKFSKSQAMVVVPSDDIPRTGSSKDFRSLSDLGADKVVLRCPKCNSDHMVQLETESEAALVSSSPAERSPFARLPSSDQLVGSNSPQAHSTPLKERRSSTNLIGGQSPASQRLTSKPGCFRSLFNTDERDTGQSGDGPETKVLQSSAQKQEGRQRSNAFSDEPLPFSSRQRSNAVRSPADSFSDQQSAAPSGSFSSEAEKSRSSTANGLPSSDVVDNALLATYGALNSARVDSASNGSPVLSGAKSVVSSADVVDSALLATFGALNRSSEVSSSNGIPVLTEAKSVVSSADSDITILNKRDSVTGMEVASSATSADSIVKLGPSSSSVRAEEEERHARLGLSLGLADSQYSQDLATGGDSSRSKGQLSPVPQEEAVEVTPMGSPLSSSICSSMVSSVYLNSLLPNTSSSSAYATASDHSAGEEGRETRGGEADKETSIYDTAGEEEGEGQGRREGRGGSQHKTSISSEVEVLSVEEESIAKLAYLGGSSEDDEEGVVTPLPLTDDDQTVLGASIGDSGSGGKSVSAGYDFRRMDHRQTLYLMMNVFDNSEEFAFKVKCCVSQYMMPEEYEALVIVTSMKLYILRINTEDASVELSESLTVMEAQPHAELRHVEVGLGRQTLRLEYVSDCSSYTLVLRDRLKLEAFKEMLYEHIHQYAIDTAVPMSAVFNEAADQQTLDNLTADVLSRGSQDSELLLYTMGHIVRGNKPHYPVVVVVSSCEVCLVNTNHQWPCPRLHTPITVDTVGKQFTVLERQKINNIATLELHEENIQVLRITFFNETSGDEIHWVITMETDEGAKEIVDGVRGPWEEAFGVEMDLEISAFDLSV